MINACGFVSGKFQKKLEGVRLHTYLKGPNKIWVDVLNPAREEVQYLEKELKLHHLALEDAMTQHQRAKVERYDEFHYVVVHSITETEKLETTQLNLFIGKNIIISIHLKHLDYIEDIRRRVAQNPFLLKRGADYVAYLLLDASADMLFPAMDRLEETIDRVEEGIFKEKEDGSKTMLNLLLKSKRQLLHLRKVTWPQMEVLNVLSSGELKYIGTSHLVYFRDVYDHLIRINSMIETQRELVSSSMEGHRLAISNSLNRVMKKLTAITAIVTLPTLIAAIYGMNFVFMPELRWDFGFYAALVSMLMSTILLAIYFKQKDWI